MQTVSLPTHRSVRGVMLVGVAVSLFVAIVAMNAWLSDDAYITLRTVDNFLHGYGLRWNIAERVQAYTHPLWMMMLAAACAATREYYFTPIALSLAAAASAAAILAVRIVRPGAGALAGIALLIASKAFVDFSTSGLENPLSHALLAVFFLLYWRRKQPDESIVGLTVVASLCLLTRVDLGLVVLPPLVVCLLKARSLRRFRQAAVGMLPFVGWEAFSLVYYGFLVPNTAYAKIVSDLPTSQAISQGLVYLHDSWNRDPVTLCAIVLGLVVPARDRTSPDRFDWPARLGIVGYLAYTVWIGGDFMSGRFLTVPFFVAVLRISRWLDGKPVEICTATAAAAFVVMAASPTPTLLGNFNYKRGEPVTTALSEETNVSDERRFYWQLTGLLSPDRGTASDPSFKRSGEEARRAGTGFGIKAAVGMHGFYAGPGLHLVDAYGLGDPLLARLPPVARWRSGHYRRAMPEGYWETLQTGRNVIRDPGVRVFYTHLSSITRGPIFGRHRLGEVIRMNLGMYNGLLSWSKDQPK